MNILFLDQSGKAGGAELCLLDIATYWHDSSGCLPSDRCLVGLFEDGSFRQLLEEHSIPVQVLSHQPIQVRKESGLAAGLQSVGQLLPLMARVVALARAFDAIYANTQKALVVGAIASFLSDRPLVYHLHDILSPEHFSATNRKIAIALANRANLVIANSQASRDAFVEAGGRSELVQVVYNGFRVEKYCQNFDTGQLRAELGLAGRFVVGHFSRLSPWKGQHVLLEALPHCAEEVTVMFVGDALFGEQAYVQSLHQQVERLNLQDRVRFLGFRANVIPLMHLCDVVAHTSTAAEPFGRVIVESMLCGKPTIAAKAGGALELVDHGITGWLVAPKDVASLAQTIEYYRLHPEERTAIAQTAQLQARQRFNLATTNEQIINLLNSIL